MKANITRLFAASLISSSLLWCQSAPGRRKPPVSAKAKAPVPAASPVIYRLPISSLKVNGLKTYSSGQVLQIAGLKVGDVVAQQEFETARERLEATGLFDSVGYRFDPTPGGKSYVASLDLKEVEQLYPFRFESLHVDEAKLVEFLRQAHPLFADKLPGTRQSLDRVTKSIQEFMTKSGQGDKKVVARLANREAGNLEIVFQPDKLPSVAEVEFSGNTLFTTTELREAVAGPGVGAIYTEPKFREILDASVRPLYETKGRLKVSFPSITVSPAKGVSGLAVTVQVNEGEEFQLRSVEFAEKPEAESPLSPVLLKEGKFATGQVANMTQVKEGVAALEQSLRRKGYLEVKSKTIRKLDDAAKAIDVKLDLDPGPQFTFRKLTIEGLDIQTEPHIRKLWAVKMGQPFNTEYPDFFLAKLREDDIFENLGRTKSVVVPDPGAGTVDVTLIFEGDKKPPKKEQ